MRKEILFLGGTLNQLTMQEKIAAQLRNDYDCWFSPYYHTESIGWWLAERCGLLNHQLGEKFQGQFQGWIRSRGLRLDHGCQRGGYSLIVLGVDSFIPQNVRGKRYRKVLVQEGIVWPMGFRYKCAKLPFVPRWVANSNSMGMSRDYDYVCVASQGYQDWFARNGDIPESKLLNTGIPNFDNILHDCKGRKFEHSGHLLFATHCLREDLEREDRIGLLLKAREIADGRTIVVKLHPREDFAKRRHEVQRTLPEALVYEQGDARAMVAHCSVFMTTFSSVIFDALVLEKDVAHCDLDLNLVYSLLPEQHGMAAQNIADVCRRALDG